MWKGTASARDVEQEKDRSNRVQGEETKLSFEIVSQSAPQMLFSARLWFYLNTSVLWLGMNSVFWSLRQGTGDKSWTQSWAQGWGSVLLWTENTTANSTASPGQWRTWALRGCSWFLFISSLCSELPPSSPVAFRVKNLNYKHVSSSTVLEAVSSNKFFSITLEKLPLIICNPALVIICIPGECETL